MRWPSPQVSNSLKDVFFDFGEIRIAARAFRKTHAHRCRRAAVVKNHAFGVARTLSNLGEGAETKQEAKRAQRLYGAAQCLFNQVGSPGEQYAADLLSRLEGKIDVEWSVQELCEKNLDDLVRWALEMVS